VRLAGPDGVAYLTGNCPTEVRFHRNELGQNHGNYMIAAETIASLKPR